MYPKTYYETFMRYEASHEVFVAMPFTPVFERTFTDIIEPAIGRVNLNGVALTARIVNRRTYGAPDIHEKIFDAILHARLVIADMTVQASQRGDDGVERWQPNANVAYEVGLAAAWRNPEDILLIHQPHASHRYSFDIQDLRHVSYDPSDVESSRATLAREIIGALQTSVFISRQAFKTLAESISPIAVSYMLVEARRVFPLVSIERPENTGLFDTRSAAVSELLRIGALRSRVWVRPGAGGLISIYEWTELGFRLMRATGCATPERIQEIRTAMNGVPPGSVPPNELVQFPDQAATVPVPPEEPPQQEITA